MSQTLGEKLRKAREERGMTISQVSEQTRISSHYLECIERDDYGPLPGGIFNRGFVKTYAKFVGLSEEEALADYSRLQSAETETDTERFRPEVLTDDRASRSTWGTIVGSILLVGLMSAGILFFVDFLKRPSDVPAGEATAPTPTAAVTPEPEPASTPSNEPVPEMGKVTVEFAAVNEPISLSVTVDDARSTRLIEAGGKADFQPKDRLTLSYSKFLAEQARLSINGKQISLPLEPARPGRNAIEITISRENLADIWRNGAISFDGASTAAASPAPGTDAANKTPPSSPSPANITSTPAPTAPPAVPRATPRIVTNTNRPANTNQAAPASRAPRPGPTPGSSPLPPRNTPQGNRDQ